MDTVFVVAGMIAIAVMLVVAARYVWSRAGRTFPAWGAQHYREISGEDRQHLNDRA